MEQAINTYKALTAAMHRITDATMIKTLSEVRYIEFMKSKRTFGMDFVNAVIDAD